MNSSIANNAEQQGAVLSIVNGTAYPAPYLIFGPPGTGKTSTVVEAICQLLRYKSKSCRILVTATSNTAADEICQRLLQYLPNSCYFQHNVYRVYSASAMGVDRNSINDQVAANSNIDFQFVPPLKMLDKYKVLVTTLCCSGRLIRRDKEHFTHVFIDECGSSTESQSIIPLAGAFYNFFSHYNNNIKYSFCTFVL